MTFNWRIIPLMKNSAQTWQYDDLDIYLDLSMNDKLYLISTGQVDAQDIISTERQILEAQLEIMQCLAIRQAGHEDLVFWDASNAKH